MAATNNSGWGSNQYYERKKVFAQMFHPSSRNDQSHVQNSNRFNYINNIFTKTANDPRPESWIMEMEATPEGSWYYHEILKPKLRSKAPWGRDLKQWEVDERKRAYASSYTAAWMENFSKAASAEKLDPVTVATSDNLSGRRINNQLDGAVKNYLAAQSPDSPLVGAARHQAVMMAEQKVHKLREEREKYLISIQGSGKDRNGIAYPHLKAEQMMNRDPSQFVTMTNKEVDFWFRDGPEDNNWANHFKNLGLMRGDTYMLNNIRSGIRRFGSKNEYDRDRVAKAGVLWGAYDGGNLKDPSLLGLLAVGMDMVPLDMQVRYLYKMKSVDGGIDSGVRNVEMAKENFDIMITSKFEGHFNGILKELGAPNYELKTALKRIIWSMAVDPEGNRDPAEGMNDKVTLDTLNQTADNLLGQFFGKNIDLPDSDLSLRRSDFSRGSPILEMSDANIGVYFSIVEDAIPDSKFYLGKREMWWERKKVYEQLEELYGRELTKDERERVIETGGHHEDILTNPLTSREPLVNTVEVKGTGQTFGFINFPTEIKNEYHARYVERLISKEGISNQITYQLFDNSELAHTLNQDLSVDNFNETKLNAAIGAMFPGGSTRDRLQAQARDYHAMKERFPEFKLAGNLEEMKIRTEQLRRELQKQINRASLKQNYKFGRINKGIYGWRRGGKDGQWKTLKRMSKGQGRGVWLSAEDAVRIGQQALEYRNRGQAALHKWETENRPYYRPDPRINIGY